MSPTPDRLATTLRRLRWPVVIAWIILVVALNGPANGLSAVTNNGASAYLPPSAPSTRVAELQQDAPGASTDVDQAVVVFARSRGLTAGDLAAAASARSAVARLGGRIGSPGPLRRSADGQAAEFAANVTSRPAIENSADLSAVRAITRAAGTAPSGPTCWPRPPRTAWPAPG
jgi:RND superfamily putative drug exporter